MTENKNPRVLIKEFGETIKVYVQEQDDGTWDMTLSLPGTIDFTTSDYPDEATARSTGIRLAQSIVDDLANPDDSKYDEDDEE